MSPKTHSVLAVVDLRLSRPSDKKLSKKDVQTRTTPLTTIYHAGRQVELHLPPWYHLYPLELLTSSVSGNAGCRTQLPHVWHPLPVSAPIQLSDSGR